MNHFDPDMDLHEPAPSSPNASPSPYNRVDDPPPPLPMTSSSEPLTITSGSGYQEESRRTIGRFTVEYLIGRGGMGEVYKARHPETHQAIALKVLDMRGYDDPDTIRRFRREAESAMALDHPNVAKFYGMEQDEQGRPILVMEYIEGRGLDRIAEESSEMLYSQILDYIIQTARGLDSACRRSIIHRDIKPENLIVTSDNQVKIIDFGLAKSMWESSDLTGTGLVVGTPRYISPEQGMGRSVDHRSDIYSLGATLYELATGKCPFDGDTPLAIMMKHINAPLTPPYMVNPRIPADVSDIIMKMMAKEPNDRYQDYENLIRDLESAKIHRLSKERRATGEMSGMQTVVLPEGDADSLARNTPEAYLTEGLVSTDELPQVEEHSSSLARVLLLSLSGLAVMGFALLFLTRPISSDSGARSSLGQNIATLYARTKSRIAGGPSAQDLELIDRENITLTRGRMDAVVGRLLQMRSAGTLTATPRMSTLRANGTFTAEETRDAWGHDFFITDGAGGPMLVAPGRDGHEKTADDFRFSLDGRTQHVPPPLKP